MDGEQPIADVPKSAYDKLIDTAEAARGDGLQVELGGSGIQQASQQQGGGPSEFIGFFAAAVVLAIALSVFSIRALIAGSCTSSAKTTWLVSVDSVLKLSVSRFRAVVDSVPGSENESV